MDTIVGLDPAENFVGGYNPEDSGEINFALHSNYSWAFHSSLLGSASTPTTADEAIIVDTGLNLVNGDAHGAIVNLFTSMVTNSLGGVSQEFQLTRLLAHQPGPWMTNYFTTSFWQSEIAWETPTTGYECRIGAVLGGQSPNFLEYYNSLSQGVVVYETDDTIAPTLAITSPANNAIVTNASLPVSGTATDSGRGNNGISSVTVSGVSASGGTVSGAGTANWSATITLNPGVNTITAVAKDTHNNSSQQQISVTYNPPTVATPTISPNGGTFTTSVSVSLACSTAGATIRYTTNGSDPTSGSPVYSGAFTLTSSATVKAKAFLIGCNDSAIGSASFTVTPTTWQADTLRTRTDGKQALLWRHLTSTVPDGQISLWTLGTNANLQTATDCGPFPGWTAADMLVSRKANTPHLVWTNTTGAISIWNFNSSGAYSSAQTHGPFTGWSYYTAAISPTNNDQWVLWKHNTGQVSLWRLNSNSVYQSSTTMGPFTNWQAEELVISPVDGKVRLLWKHTDGSVSLWRLSSTGSYEAANTFGPVVDWTVQTLTMGPVDNKVRLQWERTSDKALSIWRLTTADAYESASSLGPVAVWQTMGLAMRPDNKLGVPWERPADKAFALWRLSNTEAFEAANMFGPYPGWSMRDGDVDGANKMHLLWRKDDGAVSVWRLSLTGTIENTANFGPY